jgi:hypothetical protein
MQDRRDISALAVSHRKWYISRQTGSNTFLYPIGGTTMRHLSLHAAGISRGTDARSGAAPAGTGVAW